MIEANAIGIPVVAIKSPGGIGEVVVDGYNGFLTTEGTDFRNKILLSTSFPFNRKNISESTSEKHSIRKMKESITALFLKLSGLKKK